MSEKEYEVDFDSLEELYEDEHFQDRFKFRWNELMDKRLKRKQPKKGHRYRRDWYDLMKDRSQLSLAFFFNNIMDIWYKRSDMPSSTREVIKYVGDLALADTFEHYNLNDE